ncbi:MAG: TrkA family potassium uptake protein [Actinobacteria bacterium]|nr:TrkA family potassium uptake protein [Actinomycetota bacterium]NBY15056.1 TrkA family potassium uptake protein [Actinomycetota bacterium]
MRIAIAGAGKVGRSIATELASNGHQVLLIDRDPKIQSLNVDGVTSIQADACEVESLSEANVAACQVMVAATGDDKTNLVVSLLAKTEFGVPRVIARVNHPKNEWMFDEAWGVDTAVSTPRMLSALVEEAVTVGDLVRLMTLRKGEANLVEFTLAPDSPVVGKCVREVVWPSDTTLVCILREHHVITPTGDDPLEAGDELLFIATSDQEPALLVLLRG